MPPETTKVDVFMPWFVGDYLMATADLDVEEHGAYSLLLMHMWKRGGRLPLDHDRLARLCRVGPERWAGIWDVIGHYFTEADGHITQKRLSAELARAQEFRSEQARKGRKGAGARWGKPADGQSMPEPMPQPLAQAMPEQWPADGPSPSPSESESPPEPQPDPKRADPPEDPRARAIPDLVADGWPVPEPEQVAYHHALVRARPAASGRDPPGLRAQKLVDLFGRIRSDVAHAHGGGAVPWHHGPKDFSRARDFIDQLDDQGGAVTVGEVERTMRVHLEWAIAEPDRKHFEVGFVFATWAHRFSDLLEQVREMRPRVLAGLTDRERKSLANGQLWLTESERQEANR